MMRKTTLTTALLSAQGANNSEVAEYTPSAFGIYLMNIPVGVTSETEIAPYLDDTRLLINKNTVAYNLNASTAAETMETLMPQATLSKYQDAEHRYRFIYDKTFGVFDVRSVIIGAQHSIAKNAAKAYALARRACVSTPDISAGAAQHLLEHTPTGTIVHCSASASGAYFAVNVGTGALLKQTSSAVIHNNHVNYFDGLIAKNAIYKIARQSVSVAVNGAYICRVTYVKNWKSATAAATFDVTLLPREGYTTSGNYYPVLVRNYDEDTLEVFLTVGVGDFGEDGKGFNIRKQSLNIAEDGTLTLNGAVQDLGVFPFAVSQAGTGLALGSYQNGALHHGNYYLPIYATYDAAASSAYTGITAATYVESVKMDAAFENAPQYLISGQPTLLAMEYVNIGNGKTLPMACNIAATPLVHVSEVVSGIDLPEVVHKKIDDVLRVIYEYRLSESEE